MERASLVHASLENESPAKTFEAEECSTSTPAGSGTFPKVDWTESKWENDDEDFYNYSIDGLNELSDYSGESILKTPRGYTTEKSGNLTPADLNAQKSAIEEFTTEETAHFVPVLSRKERAILRKPDFIIFKGGRKRIIKLTKKLYEQNRKKLRILDKCIDCYLTNENLPRNFLTFPAATPKRGREIASAEKGEEAKLEPAKKKTRNKSIKVTRARKSLLLDLF
jgi:hypothetical protein